MTKMVGVQWVTGSEQTRNTTETGKTACFIHIAVCSAPNCRLIWQKCIMKISSHLRLDLMAIMVGVQWVTGSERTRDCWNQSMTVRRSRIIPRQTSKKVFLSSNSLFVGNPLGRCGWGSGRFSCTKHGQMGGRQLAELVENSLGNRVVTDSGCDVIRFEE